MFGCLNVNDGLMEKITPPQEEYGLNKIEIRDNGTGIKEHDRSSVALPHYTSKLKNFADISYVRTYGYRGEALSAICSVAKVNMVTRHSSDNTGKLLVLFNLKNQTLYKYIVPFLHSYNDPDSFLSY